MYSRRLVGDVARWGRNRWAQYRRNRDRRRLWPAFYRQEESVKLARGLFLAHCLTADHWTEHMSVPQIRGYASELGLGFEASLNYWERP